jgi:acylphosphatase
MVRKIVVLFGRVQGVGFRETVLTHARGFDVAGSVRNLRDSAALEIDVEGDAEEVERFIAAVLARPPAWGRVDEIATRVGEPLGRSGFARSRTS